MHKQWLYHLNKHFSAALYVFDKNACTTSIAQPIMCILTIWKNGVQYIFETYILWIKHLVLRPIFEEVLDFKTSKLHIGNYEIQQEISQCPIKTIY